MRVLRAEEDGLIRYLIRNEEYIMITGIIGAMEEEVAKLKSDMTEVIQSTKAGMNFLKGKLYGKDVVVVRSGIGKVNAAICTQILIDDYKISRVINTGVAGGLYKELEVGDIVISSDALHHDFDVTGFGYKEGIIPRMGTSIFVADKALAKKAKEICEEVNPDIKCFIGRVVSGDQFVSTNEKKTWLVEKFNGYCTEMEGSGIAHTAFLNNIPFIIIRAISDKADGSAKVDYSEFEMKAIEHTVKLMKVLVKEF